MNYPLEQIDAFQRGGPEIFDGYPDDYLATYLFHLPFSLALDPDKPHFVLQANEADQSEQTYVVFRFCRVPSLGSRYLPRTTKRAAQHLYSTTLEINVSNRYNPDGAAYDLWVSAETPLGRLASEPDIKARTLERCFRALDLLCRSYRLATNDAKIFPVGPAAVNKLVPVGVRAPDGAWKCLLMLLVRPENGIPSYPASLAPDKLEIFARTVGQMSNAHPFFKGKDLEISAYRQAMAWDDMSAAVVSLQTAAESTLYDVWRMGLVDLDKTSDEIDKRVGSDMPFKTLLTRVLPDLIGGAWDVSATRSAVGMYWKGLYEVRNQVVHTGLTVPERQYDAAHNAYRGLIRFVANRLKTQWRKYPRTFLAYRMGRGLPEGNAVSASAEQLSNALILEPAPYWWPVDKRTTLPHRQSLGSADAIGHISNDGTTKP